MIKLKKLLKEWTDTSFRDLPKRWSKPYMKEWSPENGLTEFEKMGGRDFEQMKVYTDKDRPPFKTEVYKHQLYGSDTQHFFVKKPFYVYIRGTASEPTGQYSTPGPGGNKMIYRKKALKFYVTKGYQISNLPGGVFVINRKGKTAYSIITKKGGTGKPNNLEEIPPNGHRNYVAYSMWKKWL